MRLRLKYVIVWGLERLCGLVDHIPARRDGRWTPSQWGCWPLGLATFSGRLEDRWHTGAWEGRALTQQRIDALSAEAEIAAVRGPVVHGVGVEADAFGGYMCLCGKGSWSSTWDCCMATGEV